MEKTQLEIMKEKALEICKEGKASEELKQLCKAPFREKIDWEQFPYWARPNAQVEGCHEG